MNYTYQDSTELSIQVDFIQDLQNFMKVSKEVIPLEKSATKIKKENKEDVVILENIIQEIDKFQKDTTDFIEKITQGIDSKHILEIRDTILDTCSSVSSSKDNEIVEKIEEKTKLAQHEVKDLESKMLSILSPFFEISVYDADNSYSAFLVDKRMIGKQFSSINNMQYEFDLTFTDDLIKVEDLQELTLPIWSMSGILHKENKLKKINVSDFYVKSIDYEGENLKAVIEDKDSEHKFTISGDENTYIIHYGEYDITGDNVLADSINMNYVDIIAKKLKKMFSGSVESKKLTRILLDNKNAMDDNRILDCLKIIANKYGEIIKECTDRGYAKEEVTIKIEQPDGTRTEKFIAKSDIFSQLSAIGSEGIEIAKIFGVANR
ncbi:hypothetical protein [Methanococcoides burtonii]|uniref:Chromosome segregation ATPase n=1 Tax=Methanococcoides burtonii (strain DSM 6242 / NBRC 107633 / OCM 468 / ACE-M) TaxID=259564 RepID=Q12YP6_METBU|nr:hypothetical protein [Methanococcoides burtonii]ABE51430.1 Hypothetical protein Mbur_0443 [Methanococcoides burtonii DSM 6242]